jgi:hypothetical protein
MAMMIAAAWVLMEFKDIQTRRSRIAQLFLIQRTLVPVVKRGTFIRIQHALDTIGVNTSGAMWIRASAKQVCRQDNRI